MYNLRVLFSLTLVDSNISETAFIAPFPSQQYLLLCYDSGLDLFQGSSQETEERVNEERENNFMALAIALWR